MSLCAFRKGHRVRIGPSEFLILQRLPDRNWQLQNTVTGEWCTFAENELLDRFANNELSFIPMIVGGGIANKLAEKLTRDLSSYPPELVTLAKARIEYLKEIDRRQPIAITQRTIEPLIRSVSERVGDSKAARMAHGLSRLSQVVGCGPRHTRRHFPVRRSRETWRPDCLRKRRPSVIRSSTSCT